MFHSNYLMLAGLKKDVKWNTTVGFKESVKKLLDDCRNSMKTK